MNFDRASNFAMLAYNLGKVKKLIREQDDTSTYTIQYHSILEVLWYTRDVYDMFIRLSKENKNKKEIESMFYAIKFNFEEMIDFYDRLSNDLAIKEKGTLIEIFDEVKEKDNKLNSETTFRENL